MIDFHQHLWPEPFVRELLGRSDPPMLVREGGETVLHTRHEPACPVDLAVHDVGERLARLDRDGVSAAVISISSPLGVEALPEDDALHILGEYHNGVLDAVSASAGRLMGLAAP